MRFKKPKNRYRDSCDIGFSREIQRGIHSSGSEFFYSILNKLFWTSTPLVFGEANLPWWISEGGVNHNFLSQGVIKTSSRRHALLLIYLVWHLVSMTTHAIKLTNRFHVAVRLFSDRSQMTSKCGKNKKGTQKHSTSRVIHVLATFWRPLTSVIYYWTDARQQGIHLFYTIKEQKHVDDIISTLSIDRTNQNSRTIWLMI